VSSEVEYYSKTSFGTSPAIAGFLGGVAGGAAQSYLTMGEYIKDATNCFQPTNIPDV
jgi:hypothetical protein